MDPTLKEKWKYEDPRPDEKGVLLSNRIHEFCQQGLLIADGFYQQKNLRPASYTLTIGDDYVDSKGTVCRLTADNDSFVFEKNSIVFVTIRERFELPYYVIARFNIRVNWVYDGVLLGTGPQVDPGFSGFLSCPLYNLTNDDLTIRRGQDFATIDFEKTTDLLPKHSLDNKKKIVSGAKDKETDSLPDGVFSFYRAAPLEPLGHKLKKPHRMVSSLIELRDEVRTWRRLGIGSAIAFFALTLSLLAFGANVYRQNTDLIRQVAEAHNEIETAKQTISNLQSQVDRLSDDIKQIRTSQAPTISPPKKSP